MVKHRATYNHLSSHYKGGKKEGSKKRNISRGKGRKKAKINKIKKVQEK